MTNFHPKIKPSKIVIIASALAMALFLTASVMASVSESYHDFRVTLCPERHLLAGLDRLKMKIASVPVLSCEISSEANVDRVMVDGKPVEFQFHNGRLQIPIGGAGKKTAIVLIDYSGIFNQQVPELPVNADNSGYGVTGIISPKGTFLLPGSG